MKRWNLGALSAITLAGLLSVQPNVRAADAPAGTNGVAAAHRARGERGERLAKLAKDLNLTDDQQAKLKPIFLAAGEKMKALRNDASLSRDQKHEKMRAIHEEITAQIKPILTAEQLAKWQAMREERHGNGKRHAGAAGAGA